MATPPGAAGARGLAACLAQLDLAIAAAREIGLDTADATATRREADERLGFASDAAVVALVGGTGVGKSTLLNAIAGDLVSPASVRRPTTGLPVAWVPAASRAEFEPLLAWLGVDQVREHADGASPAVGILDLPDLDSVEREHRRRVEALLPRVDAVVWVTDPEKYRDAVLHDDFLRHWLPRLGRQLVVLNKADRLGADVEAVRRHLERSLADDRPDRPSDGLEVVAAAAGSGDVAAVRSWLRRVVDAKRLIVGRLAASVSAALDDLAERAGVNADASAAPTLLEPDARRRALDEVAREVVRLVDLDGAERQAVAATRAAARPAGAGPLGRITAFFYRTSGRQARVADPGTYLSHWSERGSLAPAVDVLRRSIDVPLGRAPAELRPPIARSGDSGGMTARLGSAVDGAVARTPMRAPSSRLWPLFGLLQTVATATIAIAAAWLVLLFLFRPPVDTVDLPALGPVPIPFALLVAGIVGGFLVAQLLGLHAGWIGRRWAGRLRAEVRAAVERAVGEEAFAGLDRLDQARATIWRSVREAREACGHQARDR